MSIDYSSLVGGGGGGGAGIGPSSSAVSGNSFGNQSPNWLPVVAVALVVVLALVAMLKR